MKQGFVAFENAEDENAKLTVYTTSAEDIGNVENEVDYLSKGFFDDIDDEYAFRVTYV